MVRTSLRNLHVACSLAAKSNKTIQLLLPHLKVLRSVLPATQSLVATIHFQFAVPTVFWPPKPPWPHRLPMQNSLYPMMNGKFGNVSSQFPVRTTANSGPTLYLCDANKMCCTFGPSVQNLMPFKCPFTKVEIQSLYMFLVNAPAKHATDETTASKYRRPGKWEPSGLPKSICWHDTLLPLVGDGIGGDPYAAHMHPNHFCAT